MLEIKILKIKEQKTLLYLFINIKQLLYHLLDKICTKTVLSKRNMNRQLVVNIRVIYRWYLIILLKLYFNYY